MNSALNSNSPLESIKKQFSKAVKYTTFFDGYSSPVGTPRSVVWWGPKRKQIAYGFFGSICYVTIVSSGNMSNFTFRDKEARELEKISRADHTEHEKKERPNWSF